MTIAEHMKQQAAALLGSEWLGASVRTLILVALAVPIIRYISGAAYRFAKGRMTEQGRMLLRKAISYGGATLLLALVLNNLGFKLGAFLGTAGIVGVAIGFASQTSLSNMISGVFMIGEKSFAVGDLIQVGQWTGTVMSIDLLSVRLRTLDNRLVRVPNEALLKDCMVNITHFPIRRWDLTIGVAYKEDLARVIAVLREVADANHFCLDEPEPLVQFLKFGDSACEILFAVWFQKQHFLDLRETLLTEVKERFDRDGIEIPFPHRTLYAGSATEPFPVRVVGSEGGADRQESNLMSSPDKS